MAVYAKRLQLNASYTGAVGDDENGQFLLEALRNKGVDTSHIYVLPGKTAVTQVELKDGERLLGDYDEGVLADFSISEADIDFFLTHDLLHTALWGNIEKDLWRIKQRALPISFDFGTAKDGEVLDIAISYVDYAFFSGGEDEEGEAKESKSLLQFMRTIHAKGPKVVIVTLGANGSIAYDGNEFFRSAVFPTEVLDSMGAGDSYIAGFCKGIIQGEPVDVCMQIGSKCAADTLKYMGAW